MSSVKVSIPFTFEELEDLETGLTQLILDGFAEGEGSPIIQALNKITQAKDDLDSAN